MGKKGGGGCIKFEGRREEWDRGDRWWQGEEKMRGNSSRKIKRKGWESAKGTSCCWSV